MLATQTPPFTAVTTPARRERPRPAEIVRSAFGPRPNTSLLPSGIAITRPDGAATCAAAGVIESIALAVLPVMSPEPSPAAALPGMSHTCRCPNLKSGARGLRIPESGDTRSAGITISCDCPEARREHGAWRWAAVLAVGPYRQWVMDAGRGSALRPTAWGVRPGGGCRPRAMRLASGAGVCGRPWLGRQCVPEVLGEERGLRVVCVLLPWPEEAAQAVAPGPRHHVHMQMRDTLADRVVEADKAALSAKGLRHDRAEPAYPGEQRPSQVLRQAGERLVMLARRGEHVPLEYRPSVEERHHLAVGQHDMRGHVAGDDAAEKAIGHVGTLVVGQGRRRDRHPAG